MVRDAHIPVTPREELDRVAALFRSRYYSVRSTSAALRCPGLPPNGPRTFHIHVTTLDSEMWERVLFRDYLRTHPEEARRYEELKQDLASKYPEDREAYSEGKTERGDLGKSEAQADSLAIGSPVELPQGYNLIQIAPVAQVDRAAVS